MQRRTSAGTSINSKKLPSIYKKVGAKIKPDAVFIDVGCGKYTEHITKYATEREAVAFFYDPYNQSDDVNEEALMAAYNRNVDFALCSNVLNVIDTDDGVMECIQNAVNLGGGTAFFTVYEGDGKGVGRETKRDCWQRNEKLRSYAKYVPEGCSEAFHHGMMIVRREWL